MTTDPGTHSQITHLYGVYDADATLVGEASYWIGARLGIRHCSLCDITHSLFKEKSEWQKHVSKLRVGYGVTFEAFHRNDQPDQVRTLIKGNYPAVVASDIHGNFTIFMDSVQIEACAKSPQIFFEEIITRITY